MKTIGSILILFFTSSAFSAALTVTIPNINPDKRGRLGIMHVALCDNEACYDNDGGGGNDYLNHVRQDLPIKKNVTNRNPIRFYFRDLNVGKYSVTIHHDRDSDGEAENRTCLFGKPRDGVGFSNNVDPRRLWRKPRWSEVKIRLTSEKQSITVRNLYMCD